MLILAIDTSGPVCAAGIYDSDAMTMRAARSRNIGKGHAEILIGMISEVMTEAGRDLNDLARIAVTIGPGSFTGIRIGVAAARGLALALGIPAVGVTTLSVIAEKAFADGATQPVLAAIDAKREEFYAQLFSADRSPITTPAALSRDDVQALAAGHNAVVVGSGHAAIFGGETLVDSLPLDVIGRVGARHVPTEQARPLYIRGADAKPQVGFAVAHA
jgi:tRNA threonylcarbamoyl adenosine modification protein YeaZ